MKLPLVNILIANYNYGGFIKDAVESAILQTYPSRAITIVDDCSTDDSVKQMTEMFGLEFLRHEKEYEMYGGTLRQVPILLICLKKNWGPSGARNAGINITHKETDYYQILDADDIMYNNKVEELMRVANLSPQIGVVYGDYDILNVDTGTVIREFKEPFSRERLLEECIVHSGSLIKKEALFECADTFGYYDVEMRTCEDFDLWIRISEKYMIMHVPKALTRVRTHLQNSTHSVDNSIWQQNWSRIGRKIQARHGRQQV